jgi:hypothetical protein
MSREREPRFAKVTLKIHLEVTGEVRGLYVKGNG